MFMVGACICRIALVSARLHAGIRAVPAAVHALGLCKDTLGAYHHQVGDGQLSVIVAAASRTESPPASLVASSLGNDRAASDGDGAACSVLSAAYAGAVFGKKILLNKV